MKRFCASVALTACLVCPALAQERVEQHQYRVHHALFGDIGTLTHSIRSDGEDIRVSTRAEVRVQVLGVTLHHMRVAWDEDWQGERLRDFRGTTLRNGNTLSVHAWAENGRVTIATAERTELAPRGLQPINPWSPQLVHAAALMSPETGNIVPLPIADRGTEPLRLANGASEPLRHLTVGANQFYFNAKGTLVKSEYGDITGAVTFTLLDTPAPRLAAGAPSR